MVVRLENCSLADHIREALKVMLPASLHTYKNIILALARINKYLNVSNGLLTCQTDGSVET